MTLHLVADLEANKERFIARVRDSGVVWGLRSESGWACCQSNHSDADVLPFLVGRSIHVEPIPSCSPWRSVHLLRGVWQGRMPDAAWERVQAVWDR